MKHINNKYNYQNSRKQFLHLKVQCIKMLIIFAKLYEGIPFLSNFIAK